MEVLAVAAIRRGLRLQPDSGLYRVDYAYAEIPPQNGGGVREIHMVVELWHTEGYLITRVDLHCEVLDGYPQDLFQLKDDVETKRSLEHVGEDVVLVHYYFRVDGMGDRVFHLHEIWASEEG